MDSFISAVAVLGGGISVSFNSIEWIPGDELQLSGGTLAKTLSIPLNGFASLSQFTDMTP